MLRGSIEVLETGNERDRALAKVLKDVLERRGGEDIPFPKHPSVKATPIEIQAPKVDLRQRAYDLLTLVREPSAEEREVLESKWGLVFLPLEAKSYAKVVAEDKEYFCPNELAYANGKPALRDYMLPVAGEFGFRSPSGLALPNSFTKSRPDHLEMIEEHSQLLQVDVPDARAIMLPSTGYAQGDKAYKARTGEVLFRDYFAFALDNLVDNLSGVSAAGAGRGYPSGQFGVRDWLAGGGRDYVRAVPAVVLVGNK